MNNNNSTKLNTYLETELKYYSYEIHVFSAEISNDEHLFIVEFKSENTFTLQFKFLKRTKQWQLKKGGFFWNISLIQDCSSDHQWTSELIQSAIGETKSKMKPEVII